MKKHLPKNDVYVVSSSAHIADPKRLRVLCLDGGGVRGLSELYILEQIMEQLGHQLFPDDPNPEKKELRPCDYFDLMCGTSTGGLIAIMLGRLGMTTRQCIQVYEELAQRIFPDPSITEKGLNAIKGLKSGVYAFDSQNLENAIVEMLALYAPDEDDKDPRNVPMKDPDVNFRQRCRVLLTSTYQANIVAPAYLRTYRTELSPPAAMKIWQAARATSAAPMFFAPIEVDNTLYVDGGMGTNNPTSVAIDETKRIWGNDSQISCLISLGTGSQPAVKGSGSYWQLLKAMEQIVTDCSRVANQVKEQFQQERRRDHYHRFQVEGLGTVGLAEWREVSTIVGLTKAFMQNQSFEVRDAALGLKKVDVQLERQADLVDPEDQR
ncbi:FabD/lysophospholipase-like protein [Atractiella rhizophila]|nr:FabD/lysophospholipase-like protein [Atractiella rhizophila]